MMMRLSMEAVVAMLKFNGVVPRTKKRASDFAIYASLKRVPEARHKCRPASIVSSHESVASN